MANRRIVAVGLLTEHDLNLLGAGFNRLWPVEESPCFDGLIEAIDEAERALRQAENLRVEQAENPPPPIR